MHHHHHHHHHHHGTEDIAHVSDRLLLWTILLNLGLSILEFVAGAIAGSVALMADALHNTNDAGALVIAYVARKISRREADVDFTFGYRRAELIGAMIQLTALIVVGLYLLYEAVSRLFSPEPILGGWVMVAAGVALAVDLITACLLWSMSKGSLNVRAAFLHNLTDAAASVAVIAGGAAIYWLDWTWIDPILTIAIAGYILYLAVGMLKRTASILMEGTPAGLDLHALRKAAESIEGVVEIHHVHAWEMDEKNRALEAHVVIEDDPSHDQETIKRILKTLLDDEFQIEHSTLEFEKASTACEGCNRDFIPRHR